MPPISPQLQKIRRIAGIGRVIASILIGFFACVALMAVITISTGPWQGKLHFDFGPVVVTGAQLVGFTIKSWVSLVVLGSIVLIVAMLWRLRLLFANLVRGEIYSTSNVMHIRAIGRFLLAWALAQLVVPVLTVAMLSARIIDWNAVTHDDSRISLSFLYPFVAAGLALLVAWIMDIGRETADEAATLRRDSELVI